MAKYPALPLFTDSYLGDTRHLTTLQHGAYLLMLIVAWRSPDCALPNDDVYLARITGMDRRTWNANKSTLLAFWHLNEEQKWVQGRLKDERNFAEDVSSKNSAAGKASALKRKERHSTPVQPDGNEKATPTPTPINSGTNVPSLPPTPKPKRIGLDELSVDHISDWLAEKRSQGRYVHHDEHFVLEQFKNYCKAKGRKYADYVAGYRNAFEWDRCRPEQQRSGGTHRQSKWDRTVAAYNQALADVE